MLGLNSPKNVSSGRRSDVGRDSVSFYGVEMLEPKILLSAAPIDAAPEDGGLSPLDAVDSTALEEVRFADVVECEASSETFMPSDVETSLLADGEEFAWDTEPADSSEDTTAASEETVTLTVSTDLDDYAPGATAIITADGLDDGASVTLEVDHVSGPGDDGVYGTADDEVVQLGGDGHDPWTVTDGGEGDLDGLANGTVVTEWYVNPDDSAGETFLLSARDAQGSAFASFTDNVGAEAGADADLTLSVTEPIEINEALFSNDSSSAGTGLINPFVRLSTNDSVEEGYNTSDRPVDYDENTSPNFTRDLFFGDIPVVTLYDDQGNATFYLEFRLDINEPDSGATRYLSLDEIEIYVSDSQVPSGDPGEVDLSTYELVWSLDTNNEDNWIALNYSLNPGSGVDDMIMYIPLDAFDEADLNVNDNTFVTLYSKFGLQQNYEVDGVLVADWTNNSGFEEWSVREFAELTGIKFNDLNVDGTQDDGEDDLSGWEIRAYIDIDRDGVLDQFEYDFGAYASDMTIGDGSYELNFFLGAVIPNNGEYQGSGVIEDAQYLIVEVLQDGWEQGPAGVPILDDALDTGSEALGSRGYVFDPASKDLETEVSGNNFGNYEPTGDITGEKYNDLAGDGIGGNNTPIIGWTIYLFDTSIDNGTDGGTASDGILQEGELAAAIGGEPIDSNTTITDGVYTFTDVMTGNYFVIEDVDGPNGDWSATTTPWHAVTVVGGETYGDDVGEATDFYNFELFDISGTKFTDTNGDGLTAGDSGLAGVTIFIDKDASGTLNAGDEQTTTDANGTWSFTGLDYTYAGLAVYEVLPTGYVQTLGAAGYTITGTSGTDQTNLNFANFELFDISGTKFTDTNGDGLTAGDSGLAGVTIFIDKDASGTLNAGDEQTTTDANGTWSFTGLDYTYAGLAVYEVLPTGYVQTLGAAGYTITGTSGTDQTNLNFANFELFDISGTKFTDTNGDGLTAGDSGLAGVTIFIDKDASGTLNAGDEQTTTDANGTWSFTGLDYTYAGLAVYEVLPTGYVQTLGAAGYTITGTSGTDQTNLNFANFELFDISGTKFTDTNGDGLTAGDSGLAGVTIFIDKDASGTLNAGDEQTTTDANGTWSFTGLDYTYAGLAVYEVLPTGYVQTLGAAGYTITGTSGTDQANLNFANFEKFDISGTKFTDTNGDGLTAGDSGLAGVTIFIDKDASGTLTAGDEQTTTDANGTWSFTGLDYTYAGLAVYEVLPTGYVQTLGAAGYTITGTSGTDQTNLNFANFEKFDISGTKFTDTNGDGLTAGDSGLAGVTIFIDKDASGTLTAGDEQTTTDANGTWSFTGLDYTYAGLAVYEVLPTGYVQTLGAAGYTITGTSGTDQTNLNFANFEKFDISGTKFTDTNGDGLTAGDSGLAGVTIFIDKDASGTLTAGDEQTTTDANGTWSFTGLDYTYAGLAVYEVLPTGYVQTLGAAGYTITGTSGTDQTNLNFANFEKFDISGTKFTDTNGDGLTAGDSGLAGVTIFIDKDASGTLTAGDEQTTTDANGTWSFTGLDYTYAGLAVYEVLPTGYVQTLGAAGYTITGTSGTDQTNLNFANFEKFDISGTKFTDTNGDGLTAGDSGLAGVTIFIDKDASGTLTAGDEQTTTDANGTWSFTGLDYTYAGLAVYEVLPTGYVQTLGAAGYTITGTSGTDQTNLNFANFEKFDISGTKFTDTNGDGLTAGDSGLAGVTIFIDKDASGTLTAGDEQTTTDANGTWSFTGLDYTYAGLAVYEVLPTGYVQTLGAAGYTITGTSGTDQTNLNFANFEKFDISGTKFTDTNGDGLTAGDSGLAGVTIFIDKDASGTLTAGDEQTTTDANGTWSFTGLDYTYAGLAVYEVLPTGYVQTLGAAGYTITGTSGTDQTNLNFANFEKFDISGTKFTDTNGDGLTAGDSGLAGVTIFIDKDASGTLTAGDEQTTTDANGTWSFTGLDYTYAGLAVYEVLPTGYVQTLGAAGYTITGTSGTDQTNLNFANFEKFDISGTKFTDTNGDGLTAGDSGLAGVTIFIDKDASGTLTAGDEQTTTDANGTWSFTGLDYTYAGLAVYEVLPTGYVQTLGAAGYTITGTSGTDQTNLNFANFEKFDISGTKFTDTNGDGLTAGDSGLAGVTIFIDKDASGTLTAGDEQTTTDANGTWSFTGLDYTYAGLAVYEVLPTGYVQTLGAAGYTITGTSGTDQTNLNFANFEKFDISGTKFTDTNGDGLTAGDSGLAGVTIFIDKDASGTLTAGDEQTTTDANGTWSFTGLDYTYAGLAVYEVLPTGYVQTLGAAGYTITGTSGTDQTNLNFANFEKFDISGTKFTDTNGDGLTAGDSGLAGVTIFIDKDASGTLTAGDEQTTTDANGTWSFTGLDYTYAGLAVYEVLPTGYVQTLGAAGYTITGTSGTDQTNLNFANFELFDISGTKFTDTNGDGLTAGDSGLAGVTIFIDKDASGTLNAGDEQTTTDANGTWSFTGLDYTYAGLAVYEVLPTGYVQTLGAAGYTITGTSGTDQTNLNFANFELINISGYKWADINANAQWDDGETGLGGFTIVLDDDMDSTNGTIRTVVTNTNGSYSFENITPSDFGDETTLYVYELEQDGFVKTYGNFSFNIESGLVIEGESGKTEEGNFGNAMLQGANRTPGFWQSTLGQSFYDGIDGNEGDANGDGFKNGDKDFEEEGWSEFDLLNAYGIDTDDNDSKDSFLIWDAEWSTTGGMDVDQDIYITAEQLYQWVSGDDGDTNTKGRGRGDFKDVLERDVAAAFLNTINNFGLVDDGRTETPPAPDSDIIDSYEDAIYFILNVDGNKKQQKATWNAYGSAAHIELAAYNENGEAMIDGALTQIAMDGDDYSSDAVQNYVAAKSYYNEFYPAPSYDLSSSDDEDELFGN